MTRALVESIQPSMKIKIQETPDNFLNDQGMPQSVAEDHRNTSLHGFFNIDKPAGWTSHDVVAKVRRLLGIQKVGHAGTLDPMATGVLPVCVGKGTKIVEYLLE